MKSLRNSLVAAALLGALGVFALSTPALAQQKGAEMLVQRSTPAARHAGKDMPVAMSCAKCKDKWVRVAQPIGKGGRKETALVAAHQCPSCGTTSETVGVGKQAKTVVTHVCKESRTAEADCCAMTKASDKQPAHSR